MTSSATAEVSLFDTVPLQTAADRTEVRRFRRAVVSRPGFPGMVGKTLDAAVTAIVWITLAVLIELVVAGTVILLGARLTPTPWTVLTGAAIVVVLVGMLLWRWLAPKVRREFTVLGSWKRRTLLGRFAAANGFLYQAVIRSPEPIGTVFLTGRNRVCLDLFTSGVIQVGNYATDDVYNRSVAPNGWSFIRLSLEQAVPHLLLLPRGTKVPARVVAPIQGSQALRLEGDFNKHFQLYVPNGYERDALYVITPDLMALLIDRVPDAFVEMIGRQLTISTPRPMDAARESAWNDIAMIVATVGRKTFRQTRNYRDDRTPVRGSVAPSGRSLRRGVSVATVVGVGIVAAQLFRLIHGW